MAKTIAEINEKIRSGEAVVVTAEEIIGVVAKRGIEKAAREVDVVTTGTFGPCVHLLPISISAFQATNKARWRSGLSQ